VLFPLTPQCDLLWSDPYEEDADKAANPDANPDATPAIKGNKDKAEAQVAEKDGTVNLNWFGYNDTRQCSYVYGVEAVKAFLKDNKLTSLIRAHEAQIDGYKMQMINKTSGIPRVITIFSAPNCKSCLTHTHSSFALQAASLTRCSTLFLCVLSLRT
jgi:hypothetical protein